MARKRYDVKVRGKNGVGYDDAYGTSKADAIRDYEATHEGYRVIDILDTPSRL